MQIRAMTRHGFIGASLLSNSAALHHLPCQGLNDTALLAARFDEQLHSRVHALAADGSFVSFSLPGEMRVTACRCACKCSIDLQLIELSWHCATGATICTCTLQQCASLHGMQRDVALHHISCSRHTTCMSRAEQALCTLRYRFRTDQPFLRKCRQRLRVSSSMAAEAANLAAVQEMAVVTVGGSVAAFDIESFGQQGRQARLVSSMDAIARYVLSSLHLQAKLRGVRCSITRGSECAVLQHLHAMN